MTDYNHFHLRITTDDDVETAYSKLKSISIKPIKKIKPLLLCVVATEISKKGVKHTHNYIITDMSQQTLRARIKDIVPGSGNEAYSLEKVKDLTTCLSYVIKNKIYRHCPELAERIESAPKWVETTSDFDVSYALLKKDYLKSGMSDYKFVYDLLGLYSQFHKTIYISHIRAMWLGVANQRNKPLDCTYQWRVSGNARPVRHRLVEEIMRGFFIFDN